MPQKYNKIQLTQDQKDKIIKILSADNEAYLIDVTREVFNDESLDGRSKEGRAVAQFARKNHLPFHTNVKEKLDPVELTPEQKEYIETEAKKGTKPFSIAKILFQKGEERVKPLSKEHRVVENYIRQHMPDSMDYGERIIDSPYKAPSTFKQMLNKINDVTKLELTEEKMDTRTKKCIEKCLQFIQSNRFIIYANTLVKQAERDLLEAEFVGTMWNKPDLNRDELNLCYNLCQEYVKQYKIDKSISNLEDLMENLMEDKDGKMSMSIIENIKNHREEHKKSVTLQKQITESLNGSRQKRLDQLKQNSKSISQFVQYIQEEDNRKLMQKNSLLKKKMLKEAIDDFKDTSELIANIYGVNEIDLIE